MARTGWRLEGEWIKNCSCAYGCPCDFNAPPTHGSCEGLVGMHIVAGHCGSIPLDGLNFAGVVSFPGALHLGNGELQAIIDVRATEEQRSALLAILSGQNSDEGTIFQIFSLIVSKLHEPAFAPFEWSFDMNGRRARMVVPGFVDTEVEPIRNPVTGGEHRIQVMMPQGFEHRRAEVAKARISSTGAIKFEVQDGHASVATVVQTPAGVAG
jgi:hypothetical protein